MENSPHPVLLSGARLPRWLLAHDWPVQGGQPQLADISTARGRIVGIVPHAVTRPAETETPSSWNLAGALVLPALVDAHTHLDKAFTLPRMGAITPGLLGAIEAMMADRATWTVADVHARAAQALQWAYRAGVGHLRTHCDWWEAESTPIAWGVLEELAHEWADRLVLERVSLIPLHHFADRNTAMILAAKMKGSGPGARLGGFVHTTNWNPRALRHLLEAAQHHGLDVDLHMDEELNPAAVGLATTAALLAEMNFAGHVVCGHNCALAAQETAQALATLDAVAKVAITLVTLPMTNLLLQDATVGRTPRLRGLTLVKEAHARGIPVLMASDNVQDPFCPVGSFDPLDAFAAGVLAAQLDSAFDIWSESLCRADWLRRSPSQLPMQPGGKADLLIFKEATVWGFPSRTHERVVLRSGQVASGVAPAAW
jgi:cytosine/creatinine deaminase